MSRLNNLDGKYKSDMKICLLSDHHISMNPRLWKEAFFYEQRGFEVVILTMWQSKNLFLRDLEILKGHAITYQAYLNLIPGEINGIGRFLYRLRKRGANELQRLFNIGTGWAISHAPELMLQKALIINADLYAAHLECAFFVGRYLVRAGKKVCYDFEDWYSRDYLVSERPVKLLSKLEKFALENGLFCTAASGAMADALKECYQAKCEISIIYNGFSSIESGYRNPDSKLELGNAPAKLLWFSRTIGPKRGIEFLVKALLFCEKPVELHLLGEMTDGYDSFLQSNFPYHKGHRLKIHSFIPHGQLIPFIAQFKIGLAIEENINDNKVLTISNKILQYLQAGLFVIASDTKGQREVANYFPESVSIVNIENPLEFVNAINMLDAKGSVNQQDQFRKIFSWDEQENKLINLLEQYL